MTAHPTIVFDLDGTLADSIHDLVSALNRTLERCDLPPFIPSDVAHLTGKGGLRAMIMHAFALKDKPLDRPHLDNLFAATVKDYDQNLAIETVLYPHVRAALETLGHEGWLLAICTNKPMEQTKKLLDAFKITDLFVAVTGADSFEFKKPDPRHLLQTIELAGGRSDKAVMVGDTQTDILTAQSAGIPIIAVDFGYSDVPVEDLGPDRVISSFDALHPAAAALLA